MNSTPMKPSPIKPEKLSDKELYGLCKEYGQNARLWRRRFAGLLPEVFHRCLYRRRKFGSIYEFAAKLGGMSKESVDKVLQISRKLTDKPELKALLESGAQGWAKLEKVAYVATPQTDGYWAERVGDLPQPALEAFVQNYRLETTLQRGIEPEKYTQRNIESGNTAPCETPDCEAPDKERVEFETTPLLAKRFNQAKKRANFNQVLEEFLDFLETREQAEKPQAVFTSSRHMPAGMESYVRARTNDLCAFPSCTKKGTSFHHTQRWGLENVHDPDRLHLLCLSHERLAHSGMIENEELSPEHWRLRSHPDPLGPKPYIDSLVALHRQSS